MTIGCIFTRVDEVVEIRIDGNSILIRNQQTGMGFRPIDSLFFDKKGTFIEFPDLKDNQNWREIALMRLKDKLKSFKTEEAKMNYIIEELKGKGYIPQVKQRKGFRTEVIK